MKLVTNQEIGDLIRERRTAANMTQEQLGKKLRLTFQMVGKYETGKSTITATRLVQVASALGVRAVDLLPARVR
jgi:transcriptional regulator with XRE-family HTH domain